MLGHAPGALVGMPFAALFGHRPDAAPRVGQALRSLDAGRPFSAEFAVPAPQGAPVRYRLSLRAAAPAAGPGPGLALALLEDVSRQRQQQTQLRLLSVERELMFSVSSVGMAWIRGGRIVQCNEALAHLTGYAESELAQLGMAALQEDPASASIFSDGAQLAFRSQGRQRLRRRDGSLLWVQVTLRPVDPDEPGAGLMCSFVDIDERERARQSLQEAQARTRWMLDAVLVGIVTLGEHGIQWMNRSARQMLGGDLGEFVGQPIDALATDEPGHPLRRARWLERPTQGAAEHFECRLRSREGREFWVMGNAAVTHSAPDGDRQVIVALLDIDARRRADAEVARAQASLQRVIETAPLAIALFEARSHRMLHVNQMAAVFFGQPLAGLPGQTPADWVPWFGRDEAAALKASLGLAAESPDGVRREITRRSPSADPAAALSDAVAERRWDARFVTLAPVKPGEPGQVLMVASDVTEQRRAEQERFDAAIAQRGMLVKEVHHRIKNNLQGVAGLLQQAAGRHPEVTPILSDAVAQVQAIAQVYGLQVGAGGPLQLASLISAIAGSVQRTFGHAIGIEVDGAEPARWHLPEAESIPVALTVNELLTNAVKHGAGSAVLCRLQATPEEVVIEIVNSGTLAEGREGPPPATGAHGLGLVRALLPRRTASLLLQQRGDQVVARVNLRPPGVRRDDAAT